MIRRCALCPVGVLLYLLILVVLYSLGKALAQNTNMPSLSQIPPINTEHIRAWKRMQYIDSQYEVYMDGNTLYVVFSPSDDLRDWIANFQFISSTLDLSCPRSKSGSFDTHILHLGTTKGYSKDWVFFQSKYGRNLLEDIYALRTHNTTSVSFVGWSKGGAFATLSAISAMYQTKRCGLYPELQHLKIELITYGTPRFLERSTVEYLLESSEDFKQIKKTRYCFDDDWGCNLYPTGLISPSSSPDKYLEYVHWGDQVGYDRQNGVHTQSAIWNSPQYNLIAFKTYQYFSGLLSFLLQTSLSFTPLQSMRDLSKISPSVLSHIQYAIFEEGVNDCPMSSFNCSMKERTDPSCYQYHSNTIVWRLCNEVTSTEELLDFFYDRLNTTI